MADRLNHCILIVFCPAIVEDCREAVCNTHPVFHRMEELLHNIYAINKLQVECQDEISVVEAIDEAPCPVWHSISKNFSIRRSHRSTVHPLIRFICALYSLQFKTRE